MIFTNFTKMNNIVYHRIRANKFRSARSGSALIVCIVALVLIGLSVYYFLSEPFSTQVNESYRQATEWTPENIEEDKAGYLRWAITTSEEQGEALRARALSLRTMSNSMSRQAQAAKTKVASLNEFLVEAKSAYMSSSTTENWPADIRGIDMSESALKVKIVEAHSEIEQRSRLKQTLLIADRKIQTKLAQLDRAQSDLISQTRSLNLKLEMVQVNEAVGNVGEIVDVMNSILDTSNSLLDEPEVFSLDDLLESSNQPEVSDAEFDAIMGL